MEQSYRFRPCRVVQKGEARILVVESDGHLLKISAELRPAGKRVYLAGRLTAKRPFPCTRCQERCEKNPESCACTEVSPQAQKECRAQPLVSVLKRVGRTTWTGEYPVKIYFGKGKEGREWIDVSVYRLTLRAAR